MAIRILHNQPIDFNPISDDPDCGCTGKNFCQLIDPTDATQFQISSDDLIENGDFALGDEGWVSLPAMILTAVITNTTDGLCNGEVDIEIEGDAPGVGRSYSLNGGDYQPSNIFSGLCDGCYYATVKRVTAYLTEYASVEFCIVENVDCLEYKGATIDDLITDSITLQMLYNCTLNDIKP